MAPFIPTCAWSKKSYNIRCHSFGYTKTGFHTEGMVKKRCNMDRLITRRTPFGFWKSWDNSTIHWFLISVPIFRHANISSGSWSIGWISLFIGKKKQQLLMLKYRIYIYPCFSWLTPIGPEFRWFNSQFSWLHTSAPRRIEAYRSVEGRSPGPSVALGPGPGPPVDVLRGGEECWHHAPDEAKDRTLRRGKERGLKMRSSHNLWAKDDYMGNYD